MVDCNARLQCLHWYYAECDGNADLGRKHDEKYGYSCRYYRAWKRVNDESKAEAYANSTHYEQFLMRKRAGMRGYVWQPVPAKILATLPEKIAEPAAGGGA